MTWNQQLDPTHPSQGAVELCSDLHDKLGGRREAIDKIMNVHQTDMAGMDGPYAPVGNCFFLGLTGSGKSSLAQADVENVVGGAQAMVNLDEEFQHGCETAKLIGIAPTLIEHPQTGPLLGPDILTQPPAEIIKPRFALFGGVRSAIDALRNLLQDLLDKTTLTLGAKIGVWISLTL
jgi:ATP-dependent Clp protease ATP-binding subunit ClpA